MEYTTRLSEGLVLEHPIMNAAGEIKRIEDVEKAANSTASAIVAGSYTITGGEGNQGETFQTTKDGDSVNSRGLPNPGKEYCDQKGRKMVRIAHDNGKKFCLSVAGDTPDQFAIMYETAANMGADWVEVNVGCPNRLKQGSSVSPFCVTVEGLESVCWAIDERFDGRPPLPASYKLTAWADKGLMQRSSDTLKNFSWILGPTLCNTWPNTLFFREDGRPLIDPNKGLGGGAGSMMRGISMGQVSMWRGFQPDQTIFGVGGIKTGRHVFEYLLAGATAVQVGTKFFTEGSNVFSRLLAEMVDLEESALAQKAYTRWSQQP